jgi:D-hexose-6-phosphate mutarotase
MSDSDRRQFLTRSLPGSLLAVAAPFAMSSRSSATSEASASTTGSLPKLVLPHPSGAVAEILLQGAQVTSWKRADGEETFFLSANNRFVPGENVAAGFP